MTTKMTVKGVVVLHQVLTSMGHGLPSGRYNVRDAKPAITYTRHYWYAEQQVGGLKFLTNKANPTQEELALLL